METLSLREEVLAKVETLKVVPTLNSIIVELFRVMNDRNTSFNQLFNIVRYDQAISSKIISIANSAYYNRGAKIGNLERAMIVIGFDQIKNIVTSLAYLNEILGKWRLSRRDLAHLWTHSLGVACAAQVLANKTMIEEPGTVFTVAILHDIGKMVFYTLGDEYWKVIEEAQKSGKGINTLEKEAFGIDHQEVGYFISVKWRFPEEFSEVIRRHHQRGEAKGSLLDLVRVADVFIDNPACDLGAEGIMLLSEKESIERENKRVSELLGVVDGRD